MTLRIIGDVHGKYREYCKVAQGAEFSLQLGDMGFNYGVMDFEKKFFKLSDDKHKFFGGNHDNYDTYDKVESALGHWGSYELGSVNFFFIRGAYSIDKVSRQCHYQQTHSKIWWEAEELNYTEANKCVHEYAQVRPDLVITHACPFSVAKIVGNPEVLRLFGHDPDTFQTNTQRLLQACFEIHQPKQWYYGHFHINRKTELKGTKFRCIDELGFVDIQT